jgi:HPt (histidine-containing phosphotransfer) domain-containing protein
MVKAARRSERKSQVPWRESAKSFEEFFQSLGPEDREDRLAAADVFLKTLPEEILKLEQVVESGDAKQIEFVAHSLKSVAGVFGATRGAEKAATLEQIGRHGEASDQAETIEQLADELSRALHALAEELQAVIAAEQS